MATLTNKNRSASEEYLHATTAKHVYHYIDDHVTPKQRYEDIQRNGRPDEMYETVAPSPLPASVDMSAFPVPKYPRPPAHEPPLSPSSVTMLDMGSDDIHIDTGYSVRYQRQNLSPETCDLIQKRSPQAPTSQRGCCGTRKLLILSVVCNVLLVIAACISLFIAFHVHSNHAGGASTHDNNADDSGSVNTQHVLGEIHHVKQNLRLLCLKLEINCDYTDNTSHTVTGTSSEHQGTTTKDSNNVPQIDERTTTKDPIQYDYGDYWNYQYDY